MTAQDSSLHSSYLEKLIEHIFLSKIMQVAWFNGGNQIEVSRAEVDNSGHDLILECNGVVRHIQLKCRYSDNRSPFNINRKLEGKPNGCVLIIRGITKNETKEFELNYRFFGTKKKGVMPSLEDYKPSKHTRRNSDGEKNFRANIKSVPWRKFEIVKDIEELINILFDLDITS